MNQADSSASKALVSHFEAVIAFIAATGILTLINAPRMHSGWASFLFMRITLGHVILGSILLVMWKPCFSGFQNSIKRRDPLPLVLGQMLKGATLVSLLLAAILYVARVQTPAFPVIPLFWAANVLLLSVKVLLSRWMTSAPWRHRSQVLILGTGPMARCAWRELRTIHHKSTKVAGFVDVSGPVDTYPEIKANYIGNIDQMEKLLLSTLIDTVVIALPAKSCYAAIENAVAISEKVGVDVVLSPLFGTPSGPHSLLRHKGDDLADTPYLLKRVCDLLISAAAILLLSPLFVIIALALKLTGTGPAIFTQERYGFRRRPFKLYKFRTTPLSLQPTSPDRENTGGLGHDLPVSPLGAFLRRTKLDELPQLWNVFMGSMSLVGPRPMTAADLSRSGDAYRMRRFRAKPGITGLWQISRPNDPSFDQWIALDSSYVDNWSLKLDLLILLRTLPAVLRGSAAT